MYEFTITPTHERFYSEESNYGVYTFNTETRMPQLERSYGNVYSGVLVGRSQRLTPGLQYMVTADLEYSKKYGEYNYVPRSVLLVQPKTTEQQMGFLRTLVTERQASSILSAYPNAVEDVVNGKEIDVSKMKGIGDITWKRIKEKIVDNYVISDILALLSPLGITIKTIQTLLLYEEDPVLLKKKILENPYILTKARGIGFKRADEIAVKLNKNVLRSPYRAAAFVNWYLEHVAENEGDTWITRKKLDSAAEEYIPECYEAYKDYLDEQETRNSGLVILGNKIGKRYYYDLENNIIKRLDDLNSVETKLDVNIEAKIERAEQLQGFSYTDEQKDAIKSCCQAGVSLISGQAGTGKSTILRGITSVYGDKNIECCALSAKAAQRIIETTGHDAKTIHRLLEYNGNAFRRNENKPLLCEVLILDESSMVNSSIFYSLLCALKKGTKIILCGDDEQLPPIGSGNIFHDMLKTGRYNSCKLEQIHRQAEMSGIISDSRKIRQNKFPIALREGRAVTGEMRDMTYIFKTDREKMRDFAIKTYLRSAKEIGTDNTIIITPCKQHRVNSTIEINKIIQDELIPDNAPRAISGKKEFRVGAKVIQRSNDYEKGVFNGETGYIVEISAGKYPTVTVSFGGKIISLDYKDLANLELAYALTVHVTQGSGYDNVIILIDNTHYKLLDSCLLYTAITRAKKKCLLIVEPNAFERCIREKASERKTWLSSKCGD